MPDDSEGFDEAAFWGALCDCASCHGEDSLCNGHNHGGCNMLADLPMGLHAGHAARRLQTPVPFKAWYPRTPEFPPAR